VNFPQAIGSGFRNYVNFSGRSSRSEFWFWTLFSWIVTGGWASAAAESAYAAGHTGANTLVSMISLALLIPTLAVTIRRLHDTGKSPLYLLWGLVPVVGWIFLLMALVKPSVPGDNQYGPNPLGIYDPGYYQSQQYMPNRMVSGAAGVGMAQPGQIEAPNNFPGFGFNFGQHPEPEAVPVNREADNWARQFNQVHQQAARDVPDVYRKHFFTEEELKALRAGRSQAVLLEDNAGDFYLAEVTWDGNDFTEQRLDIPGGF